MNNTTMKVKHLESKKFSNSSPLILLFTFIGFYGNITLNTFTFDNYHNLVFCVGYKLFMVLRHRLRKRRVVSGEQEGTQGRGSSINPSTLIRTCYPIVNYTRRSEGFRNFSVVK